MKLFTRPRPIAVFQLRIGDQFATFRQGGGPIRSETGYVDADLAERVVWSVVHSTSDDRSCWPDIPMGHMRVWHTLGEHDVKATDDVIVREVIEIDPWTYVTSQQQAA
jgi:hypothetical protein